MADQKSSKTFLTYINAKNDHNCSADTYGLFSCNTCGKEFGTQSNLKQHETTHTEDRPYHCDSCDKTFKQKRLLKNHQASHKKEPEAVTPEESANSDTEETIPEIKAFLDKMSDTTDPETETQVCPLTRLCQKN